MSLIIIATVCMTWTLRHWTTISWRRAFKSLVISLSACWITALACVQGLTHREGVFHRTLKKSSDQKHRLRAALRVTKIETVLALLLFTSMVLLIVLVQPPWLLILIIGLQGAVYLSPPPPRSGTCAPSGCPPRSTDAATPRAHARASRRRRFSFATIGFAGALSSRCWSA